MAGPGSSRRACLPQGAGLATRARRGTDVGVVGARDVGSDRFSAEGAYHAGVGFEDVCLPHLPHAGGAREMLTRVKQHRRGALVADGAVPCGTRHRGFLSQVVDKHVVSRCDCSQRSCAHNAEIHIPSTSGGLRRGVSSSSDLLIGPLRNTIVTNTMLYIRTSLCTSRVVKPRIQVPEYFSGKTCQHPLQSEGHTS
eukprot:1091513-Prorocentrum_minimum.AAC.2